MPRIKVELPPAFSFTCQISVRISDINYGNHVSNDAILSIIHEARMQYLGSLGYTELNFGGTGMIMADAAIEFKGELFYGDIVQASVAVREISKASFELCYKLEKNSGGKTVLAAAAKTGMICYDYTAKKIVAIPSAALLKLKGL